MTTPAGPFTAKLRDMPTATCSCGALRAEVTGDPVRVAVCHCLACQRRTGSAFGLNARFPSSAVRITGEAREYTRVNDEGAERVYGFCPVCGATVHYRLPEAPDLVAIPVGAFADPGFPAPWIEIYEHRRHPWVTVTAGEAPA